MRRRDLRGLVHNLHHRDLSDGGPREQEDRLPDHRLIVRRVTFSMGPLT